MEDMCYESRQDEDFFAHKAQKKKSSSCLGVLVVPSRLRGGRRETKKVIAREEGYTYIAALRSPDLRHTTKREGDTSVTSVTNNVSVSQCAGELLKRKGAPRETLPEYLATGCRPHIEAVDCSQMMR